MRAQSRSIRSRASSPRSGLSCHDLLYSSEIRESFPALNVRYWPLADIRKYASVVAFGGKADMAHCTAFPLLTQSRHRLSSRSPPSSLLVCRCTIICAKPLGEGNETARIHYI